MQRLTAKTRSRASLATRLRCALSWPSCEIHVARDAGGDAVRGRRDGADGERQGYSTWRFRDRNSLLLTGEYRWTAWPFVDMALFAAGKVASRFTDLDLDDARSCMREWMAPRRLRTDA